MKKKFMSIDEELAISTLEDDITPEDYYEDYYENEMIEMEIEETDERDYWTEEEYFKNRDEDLMRDALKDNEHREEYSENEVKDMEIMDKMEISVDDNSYT